MPTVTLRNVDPAQQVVELDSGRRLAYQQEAPGDTTSPGNAAAIAAGRLRDVAAAPPVVPTTQDVLVRARLTAPAADQTLVWDATAGAFVNRTPQVGVSGVDSDGQITGASVKDAALPQAKVAGLASALGGKASQATVDSLAAQIALLTPDGNVEFGTGAPGAGVGQNGDSYVDTAATPPRLYGPKTAGTWPSGFVPLGGASSAVDAGLWTPATTVASGTVMALPDGTKGTRIPSSPAATRAQWDAAESASWKTTGLRLSPFEYVPMTTVGHSWGNGGPDIATGARAADRLASRLKALPHTNLAVGGQRMDQILAQQVQAAWTPNSLGWVFFVDGTINDSVQYGDASGIPTTQEALRTALSILSSRALVAATSPSFQFGGGGSAAGLAAGQYADVAVIGDAIDLQAAFVTGAGGTLEVYNAGAKIATVTTGGFKQAFTGTKRLTGLGAGTRTLRVLCASGSAQVTGLAIPSANPVPVAWFHSADRNTGASSIALAKQYADAAQTIAATFANVVVVTVDAFWDQTRYVGPGFHPNELGMAYIANLVERALATMVHRQGLNQITASTQDATYSSPTPPAYLAPGATAPSAPALTAATGSQVLLTWSAPQDGGATLTGYKIQQSPAGANTWTDTATPAVGATSLQVSGLTQGNSYDFRMTATNAVGTSSQSATATATAGAAGPATLFSATFPDASGTDLNALASNPWTRNAQFTGAMVTDGANRVTNTAGSATYLAPYTPPSADYTVKARFTRLTSVASAQKGICARLDATNDTCYLLRWIEGSGWRLSKKIGGTLTDLGSTLTTAPLDGTTPSRDAALTVAGTTISGVVDGTTVASVTDASITAVGRAGLFGNVAQSTAAGVHVGQFAVTT